ncbi:8853_t:CDS:1 [Acaulospora morrowiae]|uniref:8853_t:CDS:1 n=1 Tax=Acaulospora morrowiae TaxID=94023 RepID=A0A9N9BIT8_9GLOM|nr:8853_t:CDS:1 [Acaulospora morrowiae]
MASNETIQNLIIHYDLSQHPEYSEIFGGVFSFLVPNEKQVVCIYGPDAQSNRAHPNTRGISEFVIFRAFISHALEANQAALTDIEFISKFTSELWQSMDPALQQIFKNFSERLKMDFRYHTFVPYALNFDKPSRPYLSPMKLVWEPIITPETFERSL